MLEKNIDTQQAPTKWWAAQDAKMRNIANKSHYKSEVHIQVERMLMALDLCYQARGIYEAYGKTGISVKVDGPTAVKDRKNLRLLEQEWAERGIVKKVSAQGIIYRFTV